MNVHAALVAMLLCVMPVLGDLDQVKEEPNPEKRARLALNSADEALEAAKKAYFEKDDLERTKAALDQVQQSVSLAYSSLEATGKNASKHPRHFIDAEIRTRELLRRLNDFSDRMSALDRDLAQGAREEVQKVHDDLLGAIMGQKKKNKD